MKFCACIVLIIVKLICTVCHKFVICNTHLKEPMRVCTMHVLDSLPHSLSRASPQPKAGKPCPSQCGSTVGPTNNSRHVVLHVPHWLAEWDICSGRHNRHTWDPVRSGGSDSVCSDHHCLHWQHSVCRAVGQFHLQHNTKWVMTVVNLMQFDNLCHQAVGSCREIRDGWPSHHSLNHRVICLHANWNEMSNIHCEAGFPHFGHSFWRYLLDIYIYIYTQLGV